MFPSDADHMACVGWASRWKVQGQDIEQFPHFKRWLQANMPEVAAGWKTLDDEFYSYWGATPYKAPGD
mgnify:CR=1 FL=1